MTTENYHLLFVDDDPDFLHSMRMAVTAQIGPESNGIDLESHFVSDPNDAIHFTEELIREQQKIAVIVSDQQMPELSGIELLEKASSYAPNAIKVLLTGYASLESAKYAINHRILDQYVSKPIEDYDSFSNLIKSSIDTFHLREENQRAQRQIEGYVRQLEQSNREIRSMHHAAEKIAYIAQNFRKLDLDEVLDLIIRKIPEVFKAQYASLFLLDEETNCLQMVRSNYGGEAYTKCITAKDRSPMLMSLRQNEILVLPDIAQESYQFLQKAALGDSCIIIPFNIDGEAYAGDILCQGEGLKGVLNMGNITSMPSTDLVKYAASLIQDILGINILNARLYQKTQRLAMFDALTGLYNRHIFAEFLRKECALAERKASDFSLVLIDIDDFKQINDTQGHPAGDEVLIELGNIFRERARTSDVVARFGGEEFAWMIRRDGPETAPALAERVRSAVECHHFPAGNRVTVSVGLAHFRPAGGQSPDDLVAAADKALYRAKGLGKNRVEAADEHECDN